LKPGVDFFLVGAAGAQRGDAALRLRGQDTVDLLQVDEG